MQITNPMLNARVGSFNERESFTTTTNTGAAPSAQVTNSNNNFGVNGGPTSGAVPAPLLSNPEQLINGTNSGEVLNDLKLGAQQVMFGANPFSTVQMVIDRADSSNAYQPAPGSAYQPAPGNAYQPAPGNAYQPAPGNAYQPAPGNAYQPAPGNAYQPAPGNAYQPAPGSAYQPAQGNAYQPAQGNAYQPAPGNAYQPAQGNANQPAPGNVYQPAQVNPTGSDLPVGQAGNDSSSAQAAPTYQIPNNTMPGRGPGSFSSLQDSRIGAGAYGENGDYGSIKVGARAGFEHKLDDTIIVAGSATAGADSEHYVGDGDIILAANAGAGASATLGKVTYDEEGMLSEHAYGSLLANTSAGARFSSDKFDETGYRETTVGAGVGANAYVGGSWGDGDSSSSAGVAAAADFAAEGTITTSSEGVPIGVAANIGGDLGVEGEISHSKTTDVGTSNVSLTGGADIGVGAGGEFGMTGDGKFVAGLEVDVGPLGGGFHLSLDTLIIKERGNAIDDYWNDGRRTEAFTQTADLTLDTLETLPGLGNAVGGVRDLGYGAEKAFNEFADGDVLGGAEAIGDGLLDSIENLPFAGDALVNLRSWVTGGGIKEVAGSALDALEDIAEFQKDLAEDIVDLGKDAVKLGASGVKEVLDFNKDIAEGALDLSKDITKVGLSGVKEVLDLNKDIAEGALDLGKDAVEGAVDVVEDVVEDVGKEIVDGAKKVVDKLKFW